MWYSHQIKIMAGH